MRNLIADKEDTEQVFHIIESLNGKATLRDFERFMASPNGPSLLAARTDLPAMLDDHDTLWALPQGTVGRTYVEFMEREGLSAAGLVAESQKFRASWDDHEDDLLWYLDRLRDVHDLFHIMTGYGRDALGGLRAWLHT